MSESFLTSRRQFVSQLACGIGGVGLGAWLADDALANAESPGKTHHEPRAKSLIFLNMQGGPPQFETFTFKPALNENAGKEVKVEGARNAGNFIMPHAFKMNRHGDAGHCASELFPHMATVMDELCIIESMYCEDNNHPGAQREVLTGFNRRPMPCFGSWISYGLGRANENLPAFVYLANGHHHGSAFLPAQHQGMPVGNRLRNIKPYLSQEDQRAQLDLMNTLNRLQITQRDDASELNARIEAAELAFRMQMSAPEAVDLPKETAQTLEMYGETDGLGAKVAENKVHIHDMHATLLWLMGLDHRKLTYRYGGRDQTIADIHGKVVAGIFA